MHGYLRQSVKPEENRIGDVEFRADSIEREKIRPVLDKEYLLVESTVPIKGFGHCFGYLVDFGPGIRDQVLTTPSFDEDLNDEFSHIID